MTTMSQMKGADIMAKINTNRRKDHKIFKRVANQVKKVNVKPKIMRGGIRL